MKVVHQNSGVSGVGVRHSVETDARALAEVGIIGIRGNDPRVPANLHKGHGEALSATFRDPRGAINASSAPFFRNNVFVVDDDEGSLITRDEDGGLACVHDTSLATNLKRVLQLPGLQPTTRRRRQV